MEAIIVACLCVWLLYAWLLGHWFARVLVFLGIWVPLAFGIGSSLYDRIVSHELTFSTDMRFNPARAGASMLFGLALGGVVAWYVSMISTYYWRHRARSAQAIRERQYARGMEILHPATPPVKRPPTPPVRLGHS